MNFQKVIIMKFENATQKNVYEILLSWFDNDIKEGTIHQTPDYPAFVFKQGSAMAKITVSPLDEDEAVIYVAATVVTGAKITPELMSFLLTQNGNSLFGAFGIDPDDGAIILKHDILGSTCDKKELLTSMAFVAVHADLIDDKIVANCGGQRPVDLLSQLRRWTETIQ